MTPETKFRLNVAGILGTAVIATWLGYAMANSNHPVNTNTSATKVRMVEINDEDNQSFEKTLKKDLTTLYEKRRSEYLKQKPSTNLTDFDVMFTQPAIVDVKDKNEARSDAEKSVIPYDVSIIAGGLEKYSTNKFTAVVSNGKNNYLLTGIYQKGRDGLEKYRNVKVVVLPDENKAKQQVEGSK